MGCISIADFSYLGNIWGSKETGTFGKHYEQGEKNLKTKSGATKDKKVIKTDKLLIPFF